MRNRLRKIRFSETCLIEPRHLCKSDENLQSIKFSLAKNHFLTASSLQVALIVSKGSILLIIRLKRLK